MNISNSINKRTQDDLQHLIGAKLYSIWLQKANIIPNSNMICECHGIVSMIFKKVDYYYKIRLNPRIDISGIFEIEYYQWKSSPPFKERYNSKTGEVKYDKVPEEASKIYPIILNTNAANAIEDLQTMKIYNFVAEYDNDSVFDHVAIIEFNSYDGNNLIFELGDAKDSFFLYFNNRELLESKLAETHDDMGKTFGQKKYLLRHHIE